MLGIDDPRFALPATPPFDVGTSPFRGKGVLYVGFREFCELRVPGGVAAIERELGTGALASFLSQRFRLDEWYDLVPLPYFGTAAARVRRVSFEQQLRDANRFSVYEKGGYFYAAMLKLASASMLASVLPRAASLLHSFGKTRSETVGSKHVRAVRSGVPEVLVRWMARSTASYLEHALEKNGAKACRAEAAAEAEGVAFGHPTYALTLDIRWV